LGPSLRFKTSDKNECSYFSVDNIRVNIKMPVISQSQDMLV